MAKTLFFYYFCFPFLLNNMKKNEIVKIDVEAVLKKRAPNTYVPRFVINYLKKIAHQEEFNLFFEQNPEVRNLDFIEAGMKYMEIETEVIGRENLPPKEGKYIFACNHPLGGLDGMTIGYHIGRHYGGKVKFFSNDLLIHLHPMRDMFVPVNKFGAQSKESAEMMHELYSSDNHLVTYPSGMCSRKVKGVITDLEWKKNFITKAIQYQRDVIPVFFEGRNSDFFYNLANLRKFLGIKFNIEMMFLADEMFKQKGKKYRIVIGERIPWETFDKSKTQNEWAAWVKELAYDLQKRLKV